MDTCQFCDAHEAPIMGVTQAGLLMGAKCYAKAIEKGICWGPETPKAELLHALRARVPRPEAAIQEA